MKMMILYSWFVFAYLQADYLFIQTLGSLGNETWCYVCIRINLLMDNEVSCIWEVNLWLFVLNLGIRHRNFEIL